MQQLEFFDIPSPCVGVCEANSKGYCKGCLRSRDERLYWNRLDNELKKNIVRRCRARRQKLDEKMLEKSNNQTNNHQDEAQLDLF